MCTGTGCERPRTFLPMNQPLNIVLNNRFAPQQEDALGCVARLVARTSAEASRYSEA